MTRSDTTSSGGGGRRIKAVLFDLDDTLYPEQQYALSGFKAVTRHVHTVFGLDIYDDLVELYMAGERRNLFGASLGRYVKTVEESLVRRIAYVFWSHKPTLSLFPDARTCLALLPRLGMMTGLVTAGQSGIQRRKVVALGVEDLVDGIVYSEDLLGPKQPCEVCAAAFEIMALQAGVEMDEMAYVGDNPLTDFAGPRALGLLTVRVKRRHGEHMADEAPTPEHEAHRTIPSLEHLPEALKPDVALAGEGRP